MTFDEFCDRHNVSPRERAEIVWHLAFLRMRRTVERNLQAERMMIGRSVTAP